MARVYMSHSGLDTAAAVALKTWLEHAEPALAGEIFLDVDPATGLPGGVRWKEFLRTTNERCEAVICVLSPHWDASHECRTEYRAAEDKGKPIFPVRITPASGEDITSEWQRCDLFGEGPKTQVQVAGQSAPVEFLTSGLQRLQRGLLNAGIAPDSFEWPPRNDLDRAPYRGWQPLEESDAAIYFGRDAQLNRALTAIRELRSAQQQKAFLILGPSGVGKSSFLRAGILPRLRRDDRHFLVLETIRPQRNPMTGETGLAASIHRARSTLGLTEPSLGVIKQLIRDPVHVRGLLLDAQSTAAARLLDGDPPVAPTVVVSIDQAEELFGADAGRATEDFLSLVANLLSKTEPTLPIVVVATIRSDRVEPFQTAPQLAGVETVPFNDLKPMPPDRYREVICGPAARAEQAGGRLRWAPELVERLLADCSTGADALPLLSLALARLYEDYGQGMVGLAEYEAMGGMQCVVESELDEVLPADPAERPTDLAKLRSAFIPWLATINPVNDQPMRRTARLHDLPVDSHQLIDAMVARRLLVRAERGGDVVIEVALESLLRQWKTLAEWLRDEATELKTTDAIEQAAHTWEDQGQRDDWLLRGDRLTEVETLAAKPGFRDRLNSSRAFLLASRQREDLEAKARQAQVEARIIAVQKNTRQLRVVLALFVVATLAATYGFIWALNAQRDAQQRLLEATAQRLYAEAHLALAGLQTGGSDEVRAMQELLAARAIAPNDPNADNHLLAAQNLRRDLLKIIDTPDFVTSVAFSPDGTQLVSTTSDGVLRVWDANSGRPQGDPLVVDDESMLQKLTFSPDGTRIAVTTRDGVWLIDAASTTTTTHLRVGAPVTSIAFSPDGATLASGSPDGLIRLWQLPTGKLLRPPLRHRASATSVGHTSVAFSPDGSRLVSGGSDNVIRLWDIASGDPIGSPWHHDDVMRPEPTWIMDVAFSPDGSRIASAGDDNTVRLSDAATGRALAPPLSKHTNAVTDVAFSPDGSRLASSSYDNSIRLWDAHSGQDLGEVGRHGSVVTSVVFNREGTLLASGGDDGTIRTWDVASWQPLLGHTATAFAAFSDDGRRILSGSLDGTARWWDATTKRPIGDPSSVDSDDVHVVFPIDADRLVSLGSVDTVQLWDAHTGARVGPPLRLPDAPWQMSASDSRFTRIAALTEPGVVMLWDTNGMRPLGTATRHPDPIRLIDFTPDGTLMITVDEVGVIRFFDATTAEAVRAPLHTEAQVTSTAFNDDGTLLAVATWDNTVRVWRTEPAEARWEPHWVDSTVRSLAFKPDGEVFASGSDDGSIRLWDANTGEQLGPALTGHLSGVQTLDFSPDGRQLLSASADATLRLWPVPQADPNALCDKITHNMSRDNWDEFVSPDIPYVPLCQGLPESEWAYPT